MLPQPPERRQSASLPIAESAETPHPLGFTAKLEARQKKANTLLCVGLDPVVENIPPAFRERWRIYEGLPDHADQNAVWVGKFAEAIVDATYPYVSSFKPNIAFYERYGEAGITALRNLIIHIKAVAPDVPVILDAKRADIGATNQGYADMVRGLGVDAVTVNPYFGIEGKGALDPFLKLEDTGVIILCRTSNPEAEETQDVIVRHPELGEVPYYIMIANMAEIARQINPNVSIVVGATFPDQLRQAREVFKGPILVPGLGKQGGRPEDLVGAFDDSGAGIIANNASAIIHASKGEDFAEAAAKAAKDWRDRINAARKLPKSSGQSEEERFTAREEKVRQILAETGAVITDSHFVYASGNHGDKYVNKDVVSSYPDEVATLCEMMAEDFKGEAIDVVVGAVAGGITLSNRVAESLSRLTARKDIRAVYADKTEDGGYILKRGFDKLVKGKRVLVAEDILTTGGTALEVIKAIRAAAGEVIGVTAICNRGGVTSEKFDGIPLKSLTSVQFEAWSEEECGLCESGIPVRTDLGKGEAFLKKKSGQNSTSV